MALAIGLVLASYVLIYSGFKGANPLDVLTSAFTGKPVEPTLGGSKPFSDLSDAGIPAVLGNQLRIPSSSLIARLRSYTKAGAEYEWGGTGEVEGNVRLFDCSGFIYRAFQESGVKTVPRTSELQFLHCQKIGIEQALATPGALLWHPGHVEISLGNGRSIGAHSEASGVGVANARGRFVAGGLFPEVIYG